MSTHLLFRWDGEAMVPVSQFMARRCDQTFVIGERYQLVEHEERSEVSHRHEFAWLSEAWANLPESMADRFPSSEHLRKWALIDAGFYHQQIHGCASNAEAHRTASLVRSREEFSVCVVDGNNCIVRTAKSQKMRGIGAMSKAEFQASKTAIMEIVADLIGTDVSTLKRAEAA